MSLRKLTAAALAISVLTMGCAPDETPTEDDAIDNDTALSDHDSLYEGWPTNEKLADEGKADTVYPRRYTELLSLQSPVRNQSARGVCSIFSGVGLMEHLYVAEGTILEPDFSEEFLQWSVKVEVGGFPTSEGSNSNYNLQAIHRHGIVEEDAWPYLGRRWTTSDDADCEGDNQPTKCYTHGNPPQDAMDAKRWHLPRGRWISSRRNSIKAHMTTKHEAVVVGGTFYYQSWNHRRSELPTNNSYWRKGYVTYPNAEDRTKSLEKRAGHSFVLVGWDDDLEVQKRDKDGNMLTDANGNPDMEKGFWLFKNSWGTGSFGVEHQAGPGYGWISMEYVERVLTAYVSGLPEVDVAEICGDNKDNDFDGEVDCDDSDCGGDAACGSGQSGVFTNTNTQSIPDNDTAGIASEITVPDAGAISSLKATVDITHSYKGDLRVTLVAPNGEQVTLHNRQGGSADNLQETFVVTDFNGFDAAGTWRLLVSDHAGQDVGELNQWSLEIITNGESNVVTVENDDDVAIPDDDPAGASSHIVVSDDATVAGVKVRMSIEHTYKGDLTITLHREGGGFVMLQEADASSGDFGTKSFVVSDFDGQDASGTWRLHIVDSAAQDVGTLTHWQMEISH